MISTVATKSHRDGIADGAAELQSLGAPLAWKWDENAERNTAQKALCIRLSDMGVDAASIKSL